MFPEQKGKQLSKKIPELREIIVYKEVFLPVCLKHLEGVSTSNYRNNFRYYYLDINVVFREAVAY